jgi:hypothetical protein
MNWQEFSVILTTYIDPAQLRGGRGRMLGVITSSSFFVPQVNLPGSMATFVRPMMIHDSMQANGGKTTQQLLRVIRLPRGKPVKPIRLLARQMNAQRLRNRTWQNPTRERNSPNNTQKRLTPRRNRLGSISQRLTNEQQKLIE